MQLAPGEACIGRHALELFEGVRVPGCGRYQHAQGKRGLIGRADPIFVRNELEHHRTPFSEAQKEIRETILQERRQAALAAFRKRIRQGATIWTAFDEQDRQQPQIGERPIPRPTDRFSR